MATWYGTEVEEEGRKLAVEMAAGAVSVGRPFPEILEQLQPFVEEGLIPHGEEPYGMLEDFIFDGFERAIRGDVREWSRKGPSNKGVLPPTRTYTDGLGIPPLPDEESFPSFYLQMPDMAFERLIWWVGKHVEARGDDPVAVTYRIFGMTYDEVSEGMNW